MTTKPLAPRVSELADNVDTAMPIYLKATPLPKLLKGLLALLFDMAVRIDAQTPYQDEGQ